MAGGRAYEDERRHAEAAAAAARRARMRRRARERALRARFAGVLEERNRMAREIHNTLLQGFTGITLQLQAVMQEVTRRPAHARAQMERMLEQADQSLADARRAVWDLRTPALQAESLAVALEDVARRAAEGDAPDVRFRVVGTPRPLVPAVEMALFRIGQEAVANAAKHAGASAIEVQLAYERRGARLVVRDDGRGFDPAATGSARGGHWGLVGMRERADQVDARLTITSGDGCGTDVVVVAPAR